MGIKFGQGTPSHNVYLQRPKDLVSCFLRTWYRRESFVEYNPKSLYFAVLKGYSQEGVLTKDLTVYIGSGQLEIPEEEKALCDGSDVVFLKEPPDDKLWKIDEVKDLRDYGFAEGKAHVCNETQTVFIEDENDKVPVSRLLSVFHLIAPWINSYLLSPKNNSELSLQLKKVAKALFLNSMEKEKDSIGRFRKYLEQEIKKQIEKPEIEKLVQRHIGSAMTKKEAELKQGYVEKAKAIESCLNKIKKLEYEQKVISRKIRDLKYDEEEVSNDVKAVVALLDSPNIVFKKIEEELLTFDIVTLLNSFDTSEYKAVRKRFADRQPKEVRDILDKIFIDRTVTVKQRSTWRLSRTDRNGVAVEPISHRTEFTYVPTGETALSHAHIMGYGCLGNKAREIRLWNKNKEFDKVIGTAISLNSNINCGDGVVFPQFVAQIRSAYENGNTKIFYHKTENGWEEGLKDEEND